VVVGVVKGIRCPRSEAGAVGMVRKLRSPVVIDSKALTWIPLLVWISGYFR
jgi:hypothetical protein